MSKAFRLRPLDDRVIVAEPVAAEKSAGGVIMPDITRSRERPNRSKVLAVGAGKLDQETGERRPMDIRVGDEVLWGKYAGTEVEVDGQRCRVLRADDILANVEEE